MTPLEEEITEATRVVCTNLVDAYTDECIRNQEELNPDIAVHALRLGLVASTAENLVKWYFASSMREKVPFTKFMFDSFAEVLIAAEAVYAERLKQESQ